MGALEELQTKTTDILTGIGDLITLAKGDLAGAVTSEQVDTVLQPVFDAIEAGKTALTPPTA